MIHPASNGSQAWRQVLGCPSSPMHWHGCVVLWSVAGREKDWEDEWMGRRPQTYLGYIYLSLCASRHCSACHHRPYVHHPRFLVVCRPLRLPLLLPVGQPSTKQGLAAVGYLAVGRAPAAVGGPWVYCTWFRSSCFCDKWMLFGRKPRNKHDIEILTRGPTDGLIYAMFVEACTTDRIKQ